MQIENIAEEKALVEKISLEMKLVEKIVGKKVQAVETVEKEK